MPGPASLIVIPKEITVSFEILFIILWRIEELKTHTLFHLKTTKCNLKLKPRQQNTEREKKEKTWRKPSRKTIHSEINKIKGFKKLNYWIEYWIELYLSNDVVATCKYDYICILFHLFYFHRPKIRNGFRYKTNRIYKLCEEFQMIYLRLLLFKWQHTLFFNN